MDGEGQNGKGPDLSVGLNSTTKMCIPYFETTLITGTLRKLVLFTFWLSTVRPTSVGDHTAIENGCGDNLRLAGTC